MCEVDDPEIYFTDYNKNINRDRSNTQAKPNAQPETRIKEKANEHDQE